VPSINMSQTLLYVKNHNSRELLIGLKGH